MASMSTEERVQVVSQFLLQSPPGEINDVLNGPIIAFTRYQDHFADAPSDLCRCTHARRG